MLYTIQGVPETIVYALGLPHKFCAAVAALDEISEKVGRADVLAARARRLLSEYFIS